MEMNRIIEAENLPSWTAAGFVLALIALAIALASVYRTNVAFVGTQAEVVHLSNRLNALEKKDTPSAAVTAPSAAAIQEPAKK